MPERSDDGRPTRRLSEVPSESDATGGRVLQVVRDIEAETVTFIVTESADTDPSRAWVTVDEDLVVDVAEMS